MAVLQSTVCLPDWAQPILCWQVKHRNITRRCSSAQKSAAAHLAKMLSCRRLLQSRGCWLIWTSLKTQPTGRTPQWLNTTVTPVYGCSQPHIFCKRIRLLAQTGSPLYYLQANPWPNSFAIRLVFICKTGVIQVSIIIPKSIPLSHRTAQRISSEWWSQSKI